MTEQSATRSAQNIGANRKPRKSMITISLEDQLFTDELNVLSNNGISFYLQKKIKDNPDLLLELEFLWRSINNEHGDNLKGNKLDEMFENLILEIDSLRGDNEADSLLRQSKENNETNADFKERKELMSNDNNLISLILIDFCINNDLKELGLFLYEKYFGDKLTSLRFQTRNSAEIFGISKQYEKKIRNAADGITMIKSKFDDYMYVRLIKYILKNKENLKKLIINYFFKEYAFSMKLSKKFIESLLFENEYEYLNIFIKYNRKYMNKENLAIIYDSLLTNIRGNLTFNHPNPEKIILKFLIYCMERKYNYLYKIISEKVPELLNNTGIFKIALKNKHMLFFENFIKHNLNLCKIILKFEFFVLLLDFFKDINSILDGIYILNKIKDFQMDNYYYHIFIELFTELLKSHNFGGKTSDITVILTSTVNPIGLCILISSILNHIAKKTIDLNFKIMALANQYKELGKYLFERLEAKTNISNLLKKTTYPCDEPLLKILLDDSVYFESILINPNICALIDEFWESPYEHTSNFMYLSSSYLYLTGKLKLEPNYKFNSMSMESSLSGSNELLGKKPSTIYRASINNDNFNNSRTNIFNFLNEEKIKNEKVNFIYQFKVYKKSMLFRFFFEFSFYLAMLLTILYYLLVEVNLIKLVHEIPSSVTNSVVNYYKAFLHGSISLHFENNEELCNYIFKNQIGHRILNSEQSVVDPEIHECSSLIENLNKYEEIKDTVVGMLSLIIMLCFSAVLEVFYYYSISKKISLNFNHFIDFCIAVLSIMFIYKGTEYNDNHNYIINLIGFVEDLNSIIIILILFMFLKLYLFLLKTKTFGVTLKITINMMVNLVTYLFIFLLFFFGFTMILYFTFNTRYPQSYDKIFITMKSLIPIIFSEFKFYEGHDTTTDYSYYFILLIIIVLMRITFMNILIASLANIYERVIKKSNLEIVLMTHSFYKFQNNENSTYSALVLLPPPFSLLSIFFFPIAIIFKNKRFNSNLIKIGYFLILCVVILIFFILNLIIMPISWGKIIYWIITNNYKKEKIYFTLNFWERTVHLAQWFFLGNFYLFYILIRYDIPNFYKKAYMPLYIASKNDEFSIFDYKMFKKTLRSIKNVYNTDIINKQNFLKLFNFNYLNLKNYEKNNKESSVSLNVSNYNSFNNLNSFQDIGIEKNNFDNLAIKDQMSINQLELIIKNIKKTKIVKNGKKNKRPQLFDSINLQETMNSVKLHDYYSSLYIKKQEKKE